MSTITQAQAQAALDAVKAQYADYLTPKVYDGETYPALYEPPTLIENYDGDTTVIMWEEGPDDWAFLIEGGTSETEEVLAAEAAAEFGTPIKIEPRPAAKIPKGVYAEPIYSFALGLYPA